MVSQTKVDVRNVADKPVPSGKKGGQQAALVDGKEQLDDQAVAAAVVDTEQAEAVAAQVAADGGIMPTEAPTQSIGEVAQVTTPTTTDTTTSTTTPPPGEESAAGLSPWAIGGIALVGIGAVAAAASSGSDSNPAPAPEPTPEPPAPTPTPTPTPTPPVNVAPTSVNANVVADVDDVTALSATNFPFTDANVGDVLTTVKIGAISATAIETVADPALAIDTTSGHGYERVATTATWAEANAAAIAKGGYLAVLDTAEEMAFVNANFDGFGPETGEGGAWIGLTQAATATTTGGGWTWVDGTALAGDSPLWSGAFGDVLPADFRDEPYEFGLENHEADFGAIYEGTSPTDTALLYDRGAGTGHPNAGEDTLPQYLIEYNTTAALTLNGAAVAEGQTIAAADLANLSWNSVFNTGGTVAFAVGDSAGAYSTPENTLTITTAPAITSASVGLEDQHLSVLA